MAPRRREERRHPVSFPSPAAVRRSCSQRARRRPRRTLQHDRRKCHPHGLPRLLSLQDCHKESWTRATVRPRSRLRQLNDHRAVPPTADEHLLPPGRRRGSTQQARLHRRLPEAKGGSEACGSHPLVGMHGESDLSRCRHRGQYHGAFTCFLHKHLRRDKAAPRGVLLRKARSSLEHNRFPQPEAGAEAGANRSSRAADCAMQRIA